MPTKNWHEKCKPVLLPRLTASVKAYAADSRMLEFEAGGVKGLVATVPT